MVKKMLDKWLNVEFESSSRNTPQFRNFARDFARAIPDTNIQFSVGHFHISGFYQNPKTEKYAYFSISDVRYFRNDWHDHVLVRTATGLKDYTGGTNQYCLLINLLERLQWLTS